MHVITRGSAPLFGFAAVFSILSSGTLADTPPAIPAVDQLPAECRAAKAEFHPVTEADLAKASAELVEAVARLDRRLAADPENGPGWREYLQWDRMQSELCGDEKPDSAALASILGKYQAGHEGLRLLWFVDVRLALSRYLLIAQNIDNPGLKSAYENLMDALAVQLESYAQAPTAKGALIIGRLIVQLEDAGQASTLIRAVRHHYVRPNLCVEVSADLIDAAMGGPVDETTPVRDVILGTDIFGTGHTTGRICVELIPNPDRAAMETIFCGTTLSDNVGYNGPVRVYSNGTTQLDGRKCIFLDADGLDWLPAVSEAETRSRITSIRARRRSRLIEQIAWRRAAKQQHQAECIASAHAEERLNGRIDSQAEEMLARADRAFREKFRRPLVQRKLFPQRLDFSTTKDALHVVAVRADASQLAAPTDPPPTAGGAELNVRIHESMVNNLLASGLGGMTLRDETYKDLLVELLGELPERFQVEAGEPAWAIDFDALRPICVAFDDDQLTVTVRGRRYYRDGEDYPAMNVTAIYDVEQNEQGLAAVRRGPLEIFPPGFVPDSGKTLSTKQMVIRSLLETRFERIFSEEIPLEDIELPGNRGTAGRLRPIRFACQDGWLSLAWKRVAAE